jgi:hypothetical protein
VEAGQGLREKEGGEARKAFEEEELLNLFSSLFSLLLRLVRVRDDGGWAAGGLPLFFLLSLFSFPVAIPFSSCRE